MPAFLIFKEYILFKPYHPRIKVVTDGSPLIG